MSTEPSPAPIPEQDLPSARVRHWRQVRRWTLALLVSWMAVTVGVTWWARDLQAVIVWGWPLSFWAAAQGALIVYVLIVALYAWVMDRLDAACMAGPALTSTAPSDRSSNR